MNISGEYTFDAPKNIVWEALQDPTVLASVLPGCEKLEEIGENEYEGALKMKIGPMNGKFKGNIKLEDIVAPESYNMIVDGKGTPGFIKAKGGLTLVDQGSQTLMTYDGSAQVGGRIASVGQRLIESSAKAIINQSLQGLNAVMKIRAEAAAAVAEAEAVIAGAGAEVESHVASMEGTVQDVQNSVQDTVQDVQGNVQDVQVRVQEKVSNRVEQVAAATPPPPMPEITAPSQMEFASGVAKEVANDMIPPQYRPLLIGGGAVVLIAILYFLFT